MTDLELVDKADDVLLKVEGFLTVFSAMDPDLVVEVCHDGSLCHAALGAVDDLKALRRYINEWWEAKRIAAPCSEEPLHVV